MSSWKQYIYICILSNLAIYIYFFFLFSTLIQKNNNYQCDHISGWSSSFSKIRYSYIIWLDDRIIRDLSYICYSLLGKKEEEEEAICVTNLRDGHLDCDGARNVRCGLWSRIDECKRACETCCDRCNCVPPGTFGHYEVCPC